MELSVIQSKIYEIRGIRVMLDFDLAAMYEVPTKALKQAVRRNIKRFPDDFMFELTNDEYNHLITNTRSQFVTLENEDGRGKFPKYAPFAFTEQGVAMLSSVLRSEKAIEVNINIMRAFVAIRNYLLTQASVSAEIKELWQHVKALEEQSEENLKAINDLSEENQTSLDEIYLALSELAAKQKQINQSSKTPKRAIGFVKPKG
ncbi:MAG: ORF6N domain-containing protein [Mangrovibacterium sp.]